MNEVISARVVTRGNGTQGDDITVNARLIQSLPRRLRSANARGVPLVIPDSIELRGEIHVPLADFHRVNREREADGETLFANPRNLAAGTIRQVNRDQIVARGLTIVFFGFGACEPASAAPASQRELHHRLRAWGLPFLDPTLTATGAEEMFEAIRSMGHMRDRLGFPVDGAVVKLDSVALQHEVGATETAPRWAVAYKFAPAQAETRLRAITLQVGRSGVLTPVAELEPVVIAGSKVSRATLHNRDEIARKDIRIGDMVLLEKAGDIIPAIVGVNPARRQAGTSPYVFPTTCPACAAGVISPDDDSTVRCPNFDCPAQLRRRLEYFASKACVGIEGLGPAQIAALVASEHVRSIADLYRLRREDLAPPGRKPGKTTDKVLGAIQQSKHAELWRFIRGLGIAGVGEASARELARRFKSLSALANAPAGELKGLDGPTTRAILAHFDRPGNRALVAKLDAAGIGPEPPKPVPTRDRP